MRKHRFLLLKLRIVSNVLTTLQARVGVALYNELERLATKYPELLKNLRGKGQG